MYNKICPNCGRKFTAKDNHQTCCSRECANEYRNLTPIEKSEAITTVEMYDADQEWVQEKDGKYKCPYNYACSCYNRYCDTCGWNPKVAEKRKKAMGCA